MVNDSHRKGLYLFKRRDCKTK